MITNPETNESRGFAYLDVEDNVTYEVTQFNNALQLFQIFIMSLASRMFLVFITLFSTDAASTSSAHSEVPNRVLSVNL